MQVNCLIIWLINQQIYAHMHCFLTSKSRGFKFQVWRAFLCGVSPTTRSVRYRVTIKSLPSNDLDVVSMCWVTCREQIPLCIMYM